MHPKSPWVLVAGVFLVLSVSSGFGFYNLSVYLNALAGGRSFPVAELSGAVALLFLASGAAGIVVGRLIEHCDIRWVMVAGAAIGGVALALIGVVSEIWQIWLLYALFGIGNSGVSLVPGTTVVTRWFPGANRSLALSVASTGLSAGGVLLTPASATVLHSLGVETAMPWFGAVYFLAISPVALLLVRSWPAGAGAPSTARRPSCDDALRSRFFIGTAAAFMAIMASQVGGIAHLFNHVERFAGHVVASTAVSALALSSIAGRLLGGIVLTAKFPIRAFAFINIATQSAGLAVVGLADSSTSALAGAALFGVSVGNLLMLQPLLLVQAFGVERYPRNYAVANAAATIGVAGGPLLMGIVHDVLNYVWSFGVAASASAASLLLFLAAGALPNSEPAIGARASSRSPRCCSPSERW